MKFFGLFVFAVLCLIGVQSKPLSHSELANIVLNYYKTYHPNPGRAEQIQMVRILRIRLKERHRMQNLNSFDFN